VPWVSEKTRLLVTCAMGIVPFLKEEIEGLGFPVLNETAAAVETEGSLREAMILNLFLRTGQRVLFLLHTFRAGDPVGLYREISSVPWEDYLPEDGYFSVSSSVDTPGVDDSRFAGLKVKDAIVDRIRDRVGRRPDTGPDRSRAGVFLFWRGDHGRVYLDTSGEPLSRRGYRRIPLEAPMQETLAAAVVLATGWKGGDSFVNPMCGSGTLAIEAALLALGRAPGLTRSNYGFMHLKGFDNTSWEGLRREARLRAAKTLPGRIIATDLRPEAVEAARKNAATAGVDRMIDFTACDYAKTPVPEGGGVIVLNPEYGERLGRVKELEETYRGIGDFMKQRGRGYRGYLFTGNLDLAKKVGLRTRRRLPFFNGQIECRLLEYDLYEGTQKKKE
jgi:23S rRNA G2445 N2-methylase RlmL